MENQFTKNMSSVPDECNNKSGTLPSCAPLAAAYTPMQPRNAERYATCEALSKGTLFPALDLSFMNTTNQSNPYAGTPLGEIMAVEFAIKELNLYLDTHKDDTEAFELLKTLITASKTAQKKYTAQYGPLRLSDLENDSTYSWLREPWPWEYWERTGK